MNLLFIFIALNLKGVKCLSKEGINSELDTVKHESNIIGIQTLNISPMEHVNEAKFLSLRRRLVDASGGDKKHRRVSVWTMFSSTFYAICLDDMTRQQ